MSLIAFMSRAIRACFGAKGSGRTGEELEAHFWSKVDRSGDCWLWTAGKFPNGYGQFRGENGGISSHRYAYEVAFGPIGAGLQVCHKCDRRDCVNPNHLFLGTQLDNMRDMIEKGRKVAVKGAKHGQSKLNEDQIRAIRAATDSQQAIADRFGVSSSVVCEIKSKKAWGHVSDDEIEVHCNKRLSPDVVRAIRSSSGLLREIAERFGVSRSTVGNIKSGKRWSHIPDTDSHQSEPQVACFGLESVEDVFTRFRRMVSSDDAAAMLTLADTIKTREEPLMNTEEVAKHLNVSVDLVQSLAKAGKVRSIKVGRLTRFKREYIADFCTPRKSRSRHW